MTVTQAQTNGLIFTGIWERSYNRNVAKERAKQIRQKYKCRAVLVSEDGGVSVYADEKYSELCYLETLESMLNNIPNRKQKLLKELAALEQEEKEMREKIAKIKSLYN